MKQQPENVNTRLSHLQKGNTAIAVIAVIAVVVIVVVVLMMQQKSEAPSTPKPSDGGAATTTDTTAKTPDQPVKTPDTPTEKPEPIQSVPAEPRLPELAASEFAAYKGDLTAAPQPSWPPKGATVKCKSTRDTWFGTIMGEDVTHGYNNSTIKLKGQQEHILIDFDLSALKGKIITGARLHANCHTAKDAPLGRISTSSVASEWYGGEKKGSYQKEEGASCFKQKRLGQEDWAYPGSTVMDVIMGRGHTIWKFADATPPDEKAWQSWAVDADVVAARATGLSYGFALWDDVGNIWSDTGGKLTYTHFPNRFIWASEQNNKAPWLEVWVDGEDSEAPAAVSDIVALTKGMKTGTALLTWVTPADTGGGKTLGFNMTYDAGAGEKPMPRYLIPMAAKAGEPVRMILQDLPLKAGQEVTLTVAAVDNAGNESEPFSKTIKVSSEPETLALKSSSIKPFAGGSARPTVGDVTVGVVDILDKVDPQTGKTTEKKPDGYLAANHLWNGSSKTIRLQAGRNETVLFQLVLEGKADAVQVSAAFAGEPTIKPVLWDLGYIQLTHEKSKQSPWKYLPDPMLKNEGMTSIPSKAGQVQVPDQKAHSMVVEMYVPHKVAPGQKQGTLTIEAGGKTLELKVDLTVWNFTLPNKLSFVPEMNAYGSIDPRFHHEVYRMLHERRICPNRVLYGWSYKAAVQPSWDGKKYDWSDWDKQVGPLFDGSAFQDNPRAGEPLDVFYLPLCEFAPVNPFPHYKGSYWADEAFAPAYSEEMKRAYADWAKHCDEKGWHDTLFEFYLNNKVYYRGGSWQARDLAAAWVFDEPVNTQDFWALRWYGLLWHQAINPVRGKAKMVYRGDVSYSHYGRNMLWGVMDLECLGGASPQKTRMKQDEFLLSKPGIYTFYGSSNPLPSPNLQPAVWCMKAYGEGARRVLPWQTIAKENSWKNDSSDQNKTSVLYPVDGKKGIYAPSLRLLSYQVGQQAVEYFELLRHAYNVPEFAVQNSLKDAVNMQSSIFKINETDAGTISFNKVTPTTIWQARVDAGAMLDAKKPAYKRALYDWEIVPANLDTLPDIGYCEVAPPDVERMKPVADTFEPKNK